MTHMTTFEKILSFKDGPVQYEYSPKGHIKMVNHPFPYSILEREFEWLTGFIQEKGLRRGYECATAFGVSASAIGLGLKQTGGKLVTMDAYIEETDGDPNVYINKANERYDHADGFKSVNYLIDKLELRDIVHPRVGWSPTDTASVIMDVFGDEKLDFCFIDAGHFPKMIIDDVWEVSKFLNPQNIMIFHDVYPWSFDEEVMVFLRSLTGKEPEIVLPFPEGENMGVIING